MTAGMGPKANQGAALAAFLFGFPNLLEIVKATFQPNPLAALSIAQKATGGMGIYHRELGERYQ